MLSKISKVLLAWEFADPAAFEQDSFWFLPNLGNFLGIHSQSCTVVSFPTHLEPDGSTLIRAEKLHGSRNFLSFQLILSTTDNTKLDR